jgi:hypothetical protein
MVEEKKDVEKRDGARRHLVFYLRIFDGLSSRVLGHLMDISPSGLMLLSDEPIAVNEEYRMRMRLPEEISENNNEILFKAVSRWCKKDDNPDFYVTGFQVQEMDNKTKELITHLIDEFGFVD